MRQMVFALIRHVLVQLPFVPHQPEVATQSKLNQQECETAKATGMEPSYLKSLRSDSSKP